MREHGRRGGGVESRREINRLSFARFLVRKVVKHEVYGEINFTNPFSKKSETWKVPGCSPKNLIGYEVYPGDEGGNEDGALQASLS